MSNERDEHASRRNFLRSAFAMGVTAGSTVVPIQEIRAAPQQLPAVEVVKRPPLFFRQQEVEFLTAAVDCFIPPDEDWPGASAAGVVDYIDQQMAGKWGSAGYMYWHGPFKEGTPSQGYQLPFTPADLFRRSIAAINRHFADRGTAFHRLPAEDQEGFLRTLMANGMTLDGVPSKTFADFLLQHTIEGFFADPLYGGNKDMVSWRMLGFPGPYADYYELIDQHGIKLDREPVSIAARPNHHPM